MLNFLRPDLPSPPGCFLDVMVFHPGFILLVCMLPPASNRPSNREFPLDCTSTPPPPPLRLVRFSFRRARAFRQVPLTRSPPPMAFTLHFEPLLKSIGRETPESHPWASYSPPPCLAFNTGFRVSSPPLLTVFSSTLFQCFGFPHHLTGKGLTPIYVTGPYVLFNCPRFLSGVPQFSPSGRLGPFHTCPVREAVPL